MKQTFKKPSYYLLSQAMDGDEKAIEKILAFYDPYISKCCLRPLYDEYGNVYIVVDMELKGLIREALIKMILPIGRYLRSCMARSNICWVSIARLPTSSKNSVPPSAS